MALSADSARLGATTDRVLNKMAFAIANKASDITTATTSDILLMFDASDDYAAKYADSDNVRELIGTTSSAAELNYLDITTLGTGAASKAVVLDANGAYVGPTASTTKFTWSVTSTSTDGGTSVEPFVHNTTMTGAGGVGGRARFELDTNVALGGWANALKAQTEFGASGSVTGLGSAFVAELTLSAGTASGTYAPLEIELNLGSGASTGTATSLIYASVNGADAATFDTNGYFLTLAGVTVAGAKIAATGTLTNINEVTHGLRVKVAGSDYFLLMATAANFNA